MKTYKVYLAKEIEASGFDVEYVKSNLSRIPNLEIVEFGSSIKPQDCDCLVYVPAPGLDTTQDYELIVSKACGKAMDKFIEKGNSSSWDALEKVVIYCGKGISEFSSDVESDTPLGISPNNFWLLDEGDADEFGQLDLDGEDTEEYDLLSFVCEILGLDGDAWTGVGRHHEPDPIYAMPPVPSEEERDNRLKVKSETRAEEREYISPANNSGRRLLLRRRR